MATWYAPVRITRVSGGQVLRYVALESPSYEAAQNAASSLCENLVALGGSAQDAFLVKELMAKAPFGCEAIVCTSEAVLKDHEPEPRSVLALL